MTLIFADAFNIENRGRVQALLPAESGWDADGPAPFGELVSLVDPNYDRQTLVGPGNWNGFAEMNCILVSLRMRAAVNRHLAPTLGDSVYRTISGDLPGVLSLVGLAFDAAYCEIPADARLVVPRQAFGVHGLVAAFEYYRKQRSAARLDPLLLTIGGNMPLEVHLVGFEANFLDPAQRMAQFNFTFDWIMPAPAPPPVFFPQPGQPPSPAA